MVRRAPSTHPHCHRTLSDVVCAGISGSSSLKRCTYPRGARGHEHSFYTFSSFHNFKFLIIFERVLG